MGILGQNNYCNSQTCCTWKMIIIGNTVLNFATIESTIFGNETPKVHSIHFDINLWHHALWDIWYVLFIGLVGILSWKKLVAIQDSFLASDLWMKMTNTVGVWWWNKILHRWESGNFLFVCYYVYRIGAIIACPTKWQQWFII